jgi:hypothetical protein
MKPRATHRKQSNETIETTEKTMTTKKSSKSSHHHTNNEKETTMKTKTSDASTPKTTSTDAATEVAAQATLAAAHPIVQELQAIEQRCGYPVALDTSIRRTSEYLIQRVPASVIAHVITLAVRGGGSVATIKFDPVQAKAALAAADEADAIAACAETLARRASDEALRLRAGVAGDVSAIRTTLRGYVKTKQGASLKQANDELRALARQHAAAAKARKTRAKNAASPPTPQPPAKEPSPNETRAEQPASPLGK